MRVMPPLLHQQKSKEFPRQIQIGNTGFFSGRLLFASKTYTQTLWLQTVLLAAVCFFSFFINLGAHDVDLMEARNFVTAREMVDDGHWLTPTMNGEVRIAKPPLPTWITAAARIAGGNVDNDIIMRLPAAAMGTLMVFALWGLLRSLSADPWLPLVVASVLATSLVVIDMGRRGSWDIFCHSFMLAGIWAFSYGLKKEGSALGCFILAGVLFSCSFMSKGPVAFYTLLIPFLIAYILSFGTQKIKCNYTGLLLAFGLCFILSSIWPAFVYTKHPELAAHTALQETAAWSDRHSKSFYFYAHFFIYSGIWAPTVIAGLITPFAKKRIERFGSYWFIVIWLFVSLILLSIIPEKKERYLLPVAIPMAILAGYLWRAIFDAYVESRTHQGDRRWIKVHTVFVSLISLAAPALIFRYGVANDIMSSQSAIGWSMMFITLAAGLITLLTKRKFPGVFIGSLVLMSLINLTVLPVFFQSPLYQKHSSNHPLRDIRKMEELKDMEIYSTGELNIKSIWDAGRKIQIWDYKKQTLPWDNLPFALISSVDPTRGLLSKYRDEINITNLKKYSVQFKNRNTAYYITLISSNGFPLLF